MRDAVLSVLLLSAVWVIALAGRITDTPDGLKIEIVSTPPSCLTKSKSGDNLSIRYTGRFENGTIFDSNASPTDEVFDFRLGSGFVIQGWDLGLNDMCIGEVRKLTIPPKLGYGDQGFDDDIPPGATLLFDVELIDIQETL